MVKQIGVVYVWLTIAEDDDCERIVSIKTADNVVLSLVTGQLDIATSALPHIRELATELSQTFRLVAFGAGVTMETIEPQDDEDD